MNDKELSASTEFLARRKDLEWADDFYSAVIACSDWMTDYYKAVAGQAPDRTDGEELSSMLREMIERVEIMALRTRLSGMEVSGQ